MSKQSTTYDEYCLENPADEDVINASFESTPASYCAGCGVMYILRLSPRPCPFLSLEQASVTDGVKKMAQSSTLSSVDLPRAVEENIPSYYEHLSLSLLAPDTPEEVLTPRKKRRLQTSVLPLPAHMTTIGDFLQGVVAYVEVRSDLGDHSGAIGALLFRMGAYIVASLSSSVTHAVLCSARLSIIQKAESMKVKIVAARWVMACKDQLRKVEEEDWPMLTNAEGQKGIRQYRYRVSGVNDTPSPMSIRNLSLLSRKRKDQSQNGLRRQEDPPSPPRRVLWPSPRKSLRKMLFSQSSQFRWPLAFRDFESEGETSLLSIPETQDIVEVPETQTDNTDMFVSIPETDPAMFDSPVKRMIENYSTDISELQETQPNDTALRTPEEKKRNQNGEHIKSPLESRLPKYRAQPSVELDNSMVDFEYFQPSRNDLEESFNSLSVHDESAISSEGSKKISASANNSDIIIENFDVTDAKVAGNDSISPWLPASQESHMELTRVAKIVPALTVSRPVPTNVTMILTQPMSTAIFSEGIHVESGQVVSPGSGRSKSVAAALERNSVSEEAFKADHSTELQTFGSCKTPSLELVLPQGASQNRVSADLSTLEGTKSLTSSKSNPLNTFSEEIAMTWCFEENEVRISGEAPSRVDLESMNFTAGSDDLIDNECAITFHRSKTKEVEKGGHEPTKSTSVSSWKDSLETVTPISERIQARVSGVFSDDNSPCIDAKRTIVLTGFKHKRVLVKGLKDLTRKQGHFEIANEVTTRTEIVVLDERKRTLTVLLGISWGCWFVTPEWATECISAGRWLKPKSFEIRDYLAPMVRNRIARTGHADESKVKIFQDCKVFISRRRDMKPPAHALQRMILQAGGKVVFNSRQAHVYVGLSKPVKKLSCHCVSPSWVVESVAEGQAQPFNLFEL